MTAMILGRTSAGAAAVAVPHDLVSVLSVVPTRASQAQRLRRAAISTASEIQVGDRLVPYECFDFPDDLLMKGGLEPPFSASGSWGTVPLGSGPLFAGGVSPRILLHQFRNYALARLLACELGLFRVRYRDEFCPPSA